MKVGRYPLRELMQLRGKKQVPQLRLSDQDELQDLKLVGVDVGNHSQMFQRFGLEILRLVNDQDRSASIGELAMEVIL